MHPLGGERRFGRRQIAREPHRDLAFDADADVVAVRSVAPLSCTPLANTPPPQGCGMSRYCCITALVQPIL